MEHWLPQDATQTRTSQVWLITGCSSGIGRSLVSAVVARGDKVIATARRICDLTYTEGLGNVKALALDVTATEDILRQKIDEAIYEFGRIDVLVNNAGYVLSGVWEELSDEDAKRQFETNFFGAMNLTRTVLGHMRPRRAGTVLFMGSIAGWNGVAAGGGYSASKFALEGAVESLSKEIETLGIRVHILVLGQFRTNILDSTRKQSRLEAGQGMTDYAGVKKQLADIHATTNGMQPGDPARGVERIVDIARLKNIPASGASQLPLRIPVGSDAVDVMRQKCLDTLELLDKWESFSRSTDFPDKLAVPGYYR